MRRSHRRRCVRVSIALVKKRALLAPNGASSAAIGGAVKIARQHDAVVDRDPVVVDAELEIGQRRDDDAGADVTRALGFERRRAEHLRRRRVDRQRQRLHRHEPLAEIEEVGRRRRRRTTGRATARGSRC